MQRLLGNSTEVESFAVILDVFMHVHSPSAINCRQKQRSACGAAVAPTAVVPAPAAAAAAGAGALAFQTTDFPSGSVEWEWGKNYRVWVKNPQVEELLVLHLAVGSFPQNQLR